MDYTTIIDTTTSSQSSAVFYGLMGAASGLILSSIGAAYGSSKPNIFHSQSSSSTNKQLTEWENADSSSTFNNQNKSILSGIIPFIPIIIAGGLVLGFTCLASGIAVGIVGKNGLHAISENKSSPVRLVLNLIYCEALGLYGLIFAIIAASAF